MKKERTSTRKTASGMLFALMGEYVKKNFPKLISSILTFLLACLLSFFRIATTNTISSYNINDYEVGQIADITIVANKTLPADYENPVSVEKGEKVMRKGFPITEEGYAKLKRMAESRAYLDYRAFANSVIYLMLLTALYFFLFSRTCLGKDCEFKEIVTENVFFILTYATAVLATKTVLFSSAFTLPVILPAVFFTFLMTILFGHLDAVFFSFITAFGVLNASGYLLVPALYTLCIMLTASRVVCKIEHRIDLVFASLLQGILCAAFLLVFKIVFNGTLFIDDGLISIVGVTFNGFISGILCLGFLTPLEYLLNTASVFRLMDLSDLNSVIMKDMQKQASGTFSHSVMVANLAETACRAIGANPLIARVGGYYHDIGKIDNPEYFTENQRNGENKHDEINPSLSVSIIRSHVKKGVDKARELRLPPQVVNIIKEHHGNQVIKYFFKEAKKVDPNVSEEDYSYTGTPPTTRESGVVMLADTVEAASRSLENPSVSRLEKFIQTLVADKIEEHQLDDCGLTFRDLTTVKDVFVETLATANHSRVKYPDQKDPDTGKPAAEAEAAPAADETKAEKTPEAPAEAEAETGNAEQPAKKGKGGGKEKKADGK